MADQANGGTPADPTDTPSEDDAAKTAANSPVDADGKSEAEKVEKLEDAQRDAAKEREDNRGYQ